jgi:predicted acyltransferase
MTGPEPSARRLDSVDALRGLTVAAMLLVNNPGDWGHVFAPLRHAEWHGCTPTDLIFPFFLFIVGVSVALASRTAWLGRALRLLAFGLALNLVGYLVTDGPTFRIPGVLQRIGLCYGAVALLAWHTRERTQWVVFGVLVVGYGLLLLAGESLEPFANLADRVDTALLAPFVYQFEAISGRGHDPEGLLSTLPAIATTLAGVFAGRWLRGGRRQRLALAGALFLGAGFACQFVLPFNKNLWTPSFVLWTAGWAMLATAIAHELIDRRGWPALGRSLGRNAIALYVGSMLMAYGLIALDPAGAFYARAFASWLVPLVGRHGASLAFAVAFVALWWLIARVLEARRVYLRV